MGCNARFLMQASCFKGFRRSLANCIFAVKRWGVTNIENGLYATCKKRHFRYEKHEAIVKEGEL